MSDIEAAAERNLLWAISDCEAYCRGVTRDIQRDAVERVAKALSYRLASDRAEAAERAKPIDSEWLVEIGFEPLMCGGIGLMRREFQIESHRDGRWVVNCLACEPSRFTTRGQLLDLMRALKGGAT